eukprot:TRINITY_DN6105_c0_g1_i2.p1 TRINITY_DN6105_c0_g1~~TRINITY_DN6105_c0_g1_i2.p1  ORF type:complete len:246 (-),score=39.70 TRINITY_DN6105_c0_g1_i2:260-907(-)
MCIRDRYQRRVHGEKQQIKTKSEQPKTMGKIRRSQSPQSDSSSLSEQFRSPIRKRHRRLTAAEKEKLFDMIIFKRFKMKEMAEKMGVHYLTVKNFIRRRRREYFDNGKDVSESRICSHKAILCSALIPLIEIKSTVGGLKVDQYACRMEEKMKERPPSTRCEFTEINYPHRPLMICYTIGSFKPNDNQMAQRYLQSPTSILHSSSSLNQMVLSPF